VNNLVDSSIVKLLYKASQAGVKVKLIVRSMFSVVTGKKGYSENIEAISIVDKFLEHSRFFIFCNGGNLKVFISSADLMPRNIDQRVEVTCPIYEEGIKKELISYFDRQWQDNVKARILDENLTNQIRKNDIDKQIRSQWTIYEDLKAIHQFS
jgi:polyphosphate kinase